MKSLLEKAFNEASKLPPEDQESFAARLLDQLKTERPWRRSFAFSARELAELAEEALKEHAAAKAKAFDRGEF